MFLKLGCSFSDKNGSYQPGDVVDVSRDDAKRLLELDLAVQASKPSSKPVAEVKVKPADAEASAEAKANPVDSDASPEDPKGDDPGASPVAGES